MPSITRRSSLAIVLALVTTVQAQVTMTGKWQGETPSGSRVVLDLTATETSLTGMLTMNGQTVPIGDGVVSDGTFTFTVTRGDRREGFTGEVVDDDHITVWMDRMGREAAAILTRAKS